MNAFLRQNPAIVYMSLYAITQSLVWGLVRYLAEDLSTATLFFFRNLIGLFTIIPLLLSHGVNLFCTQHFSLHFLRALAAFVGGLSIFYAVAHMSLAGVVAITFSAPLFASIGAALLFKEKLTSVRIISLLVGFIGVLIVLRPTLTEQIDGIIAANAAAIMTAIAFLAVKKLSTLEESNTVVAYPFLLILPFSALLAYFDWSTPTLTDIPLLLLMGLGISAAQYAMVKAFSLADMSAVLPFDFLRLIVAIIIGTLFFGDVIDSWVLIGGVLILTSSFYLAKKTQFIAASNTVRMANK